MRQAVSPSADRVYGLARVARCGDVSRATVYRHRQAPVVPKRRPGPVGPCDDATLLQHIKKAIAASRFTGVRSSPGRVRRLMRENGLLAPHASGRTRGTTAPSPPRPWTWGTDMTQSVWSGRRSLLELSGAPTPVLSSPWGASLLAPAATGADL